MTPGEKALTHAYAHAELLMENLEVAIHELKVAKEPYKQLEDKLVKFRSVSRAVFKGINKNLEANGELKQIKADLEKLFDETWS
jgi:hypothetical protein